MIDTGLLSETSVWMPFLATCLIVTAAAPLIFFPILEDFPPILLLCPILGLVFGYIFAPPSQQSGLVFKFDNIDAKVWTIAAVPDLDDLLRDLPSLASTTCLLTSPNAADKRFDCTFVRIDSNQQQTSIRPMDKGLFAPEKPRAVRYEVWGTEEWRAAQISKTSDCH